MSISAKCCGRFGNFMFIYSYMRLLAKINKLQVVTPWKYPEIIKATEPEDGVSGSGTQVVIRDMCVADHGIPHHLKDLRKKTVMLQGYFQHTDYIYHDEAYIRSIWQPEPVEKRPPSDIVMHLRLGDYFDLGLRSAISPNWHEQVLNMLCYSPKKHNVYIVVEDANDPFLRNYDCFRPTIISQTAKEDFDFIRSFDTIISSNSSFSWWAAFLSDASRIYTFEPWLRFPEDEHINLAYMRGATPVSGGFCKQKGVTTKKAAQIGTNDSKTNDTFKDICKERNIEYAYLIEPLGVYNTEIEEHYKDLPHEIHNIAITSDPELKEANLYKLGDITRHYSLIKRKTHPCREKGEITHAVVPCKTFTKFCEENDIEALDTLYIDAEGLDYEILMSVDFDKIKVDNIIFEEWDHDNDDENDKYRTGGDLFVKLTEKLKEYGYKLDRYQQRNIRAWK